MRNDESCGRNVLWHLPHHMIGDENELQDLVGRVMNGDTEALATLFAFYRDRLWRIVNFRIDRRLAGRVDADDILQESYLNAAQRIEHFVRDNPRSFFVWLRLIVSQTMIDVHRRHLGAQMRDARKDVSIQSGWSAAATSFSLSFHLLGHLTSPSQAALRAELSEQIDIALLSMNEIDREVLALRHFEELSNSETAEVLKLTEPAASMRYLRALSRLQDVLSRIPGFFDDP